jgi:hypothetical protein
VRKATRNWAGREFVRGKTDSHEKLDRWPLKKPRFENDREVAWQYIFRGLFHPSAIGTDFIVMQTASGRIDLQKKQSLFDREVWKMKFALIMK